MFFYNFNVIVCVWKTGVVGGYFILFLYSCMNFILLVIKFLNHFLCNFNYKKVEILFKKFFYLFVFQLLVIFFPLLKQYWLCSLLFFVNTSKIMAIPFGREKREFFFSFGQKTTVKLSLIKNCLRIDLVLKY